MPTAERNAPTAPSYAPLTSSGIRWWLSLTPEMRADQEAWIASETAKGRSAPYTLEEEIRRAEWRREHGYRFT